jgi:hypothetical protein
VRRQPAANRDCCGDSGEFPCGRPVFPLRPEIKPILEINPDHPIVTGLKGVDDEIRIEDVSYLLYEQALLVEGIQLKPANFVKRLNRVMEIDSTSTPGLLARQTVRG